MLLAPICTIDSKLECDAHIVLEMFGASLGEQFSNSDGGKLSSSRNKYARMLDPLPSVSLTVISGSSLVPRPQHTSSRQSEETPLAAAQNRTLNKLEQRVPGYDLCNIKDTVSVRASRNRSLAFVTKRFYYAANYINFNALECLTVPNRPFATIFFINFRKFSSIVLL